MAGEHLTAAELRARIEEQRALRVTLKEERSALTREIEEAKERQQLRRELERESQINIWVRSGNGAKRRIRTRIDNDEAGDVDGAPQQTEKKPTRTPSLAKTTVSYASAVVKREYVWEVQGLSWLEQQLTQEGRECTSSDIFEVDPSDDCSTYLLAFSPRGGSLKHKTDDRFEMFDDDLCGTLALIRTADNYGTNLCYRFFVRDASGEFQPLGDTTRVAVPARGEASCFVGGPDLETESKGLFGLSFDELLGSEWVKDDSICFKVCIEEAAMKEHPSQGQVFVGKMDVVYERKPPSVEVPPPTLKADFISLLTEGRHSDVTIEAVYGEAAPVTFSAHTNILSQRSDVFAAAFAHEMRESTTRTLTVPQSRGLAAECRRCPIFTPPSCGQVTDVPPPALKALLHFLYTDDFDEVLKVLREEGSSEASSSSSAAAASGGASSGAAEQSIAQLQAVLAAAHKTACCGCCAGRRGSCATSCPARWRARPSASRTSTAPPSSSATASPS